MANAVHDSSPATSAAHMPHRYRSLGVMTGVGVVDNTEAGVTSTVFPSIAKALNLDSANLGTLAALGKVAAVPMGPLIVWLAGKIGRKNVLALTSVTAGICGILAGFSHGFTNLLIWNTLMAAIANGAGPVANSVIADSFEDNQRGKATGYYYGIMALISAFVGPAIALFTKNSDGWRYAMWTLGGFCILIAVLVLTLFVDPKVGGAEKELAGLDDPQRALSRVSVASVASLFRIPSYVIMMVSRLLSGHLLLSVFGIQFLVKERHFTNATAASVLIPFGIGAFAANVVGGHVVAWLDRSHPRRGRVVYIVLVQFLWAVTAYFATQSHWRGIGTYCIFWFFLGCFQGANPPVNRPIVMSVVLPELRGQAFAIWLTVFEVLGWAGFSYGAGALAKSLGIQQAFLIFVVGLVAVNGVFLMLLLVFYPKDVRNVHDELLRRRDEVVAPA